MVQTVSCSLFFHATLLFGCVYSQSSTSTSPCASFGELYQPSTTDKIVTFDDVDTPYHTTLSSTSPAVPYTLTQYGVPSSNGTIPALNSNTYTAFLTTQTTLDSLVTLNGTTKQASLWTLAPYTLESFDQFQSFAFSSTTLKDPYIKAKIDKSLLYFTDPSAAEDEFVADLLNVTSYNLIFSLKKVDSTTVKYIDMFTNIDFSNPSNQYYVMDADAMSTVPSLQGTSKTYQSVGAVVLLSLQASTFNECVVSCSKKLIPVVTRVSIPDSENNTNMLVRTFSKNKSTDSAWILGMLSAKAALSQYGVGVGHIANFHLPASTLQMAFFNNLDANHPVRLVYEPFSYYTMQTDTAIVTGLITINWSPLQGVDGINKLAQIWNASQFEYAYPMLLPSAYLGAHGINEEDMTVNEPWDVLPWAKNVIIMEQIASQYVQSTLDVIEYTTDCIITGDVQLQAMMENAMGSGPGDGRMGPLANNGFNVHTVSDLQKIFTTYIYSTLQHGMGRIATTDLNARFPWTVPNLQHAAFLLDDDTKIYTESELLGIMPSTLDLSEYDIFNQFFESTKPYATLEAPASEVYENCVNTTYHLGLVQAFQNLQKSIESRISQTVKDNNGYIHGTASNISELYNNFPLGTLL
eukprot:CFRG7220T1